MDLNQLEKEIRMILYREGDPDVLLDQIGRVLRLCDCELELNVMEDDKVIIVDASPCVQFIRVKGTSLKRIYQVIPEDSPLQKYSKRGYYDKERKTYAKETLKGRRLRQSA